MDSISVIILTAINIFACLALPKLLSMVLSSKQKPSLISVNVSETETL